MPVPAMYRECASRELTRSTAPPDTTVIDVLSNRPLTASATPSDTVTNEVAILPVPASVSLPEPETVSDEYCSPSSGTVSVESPDISITAGISSPGAGGVTSSAFAVAASAAKAMTMLLMVAGTGTLFLVFMIDNAFILIVPNFCFRCWEFWRIGVFFEIFSQTPKPLISQ